MIAMSMREVMDTAQRLRRELDAARDVLRAVEHLAEEIARSTDEDPTRIRANAIVDQAYALLRRST